MNPPQKWNATKAGYLTLAPGSYEARHAPSHVVVGAGIPGYTGHVPHNPGWTLPHRRPDLQSPSIRPYLEADGKGYLAELENYTPQAPHMIDHEQLDRRAMPKSAQFASLPCSHKHACSDTRLHAPLQPSADIPPPGYTGHLPRQKEHSYGTSHWRKDAPASRASEAAFARSVASNRANQSKPKASAAPKRTPNEALQHILGPAASDRFSC